MKLFTQPQMQELIANGQPENCDSDHHPVVKLFIPGTGCTWLLTQLDPENTDLAFGLCDLGLGFPELGYVSLTEITSVRSRIGLKLERDRFFEAKFPISVYALAASKHEVVVDDETVLAAAVL